MKKTDVSVCGQRLVLVFVTVALVNKHLLAVDKGRTCCVVVEGYLL